MYRNKSKIFTFENKQHASYHNEWYGKAWGEQWHIWGRYNTKILGVLVVSGTRRNYIMRFGYKFDVRFNLYMTNISQKPWRSTNITIGAKTLILKLICNEFESMDHK